MTIRHLKIFIAVAESGKMSSAAKKLYITQPTVSQVIAEIEENYGARLFERLSKKLYITDAGKQLLGYARHIVALFDEMERNLKNSADHVLLRIGATITVGTCVMTDIITSYERENPYVQTRIFVANTQIIEQMLCNSELDIALVEGNIKNEELLVRPVIEDELVLVCGCNHPFFSREDIFAEELNGECFLLREEGSGTREKFDDYVREHNIKIIPKCTSHCSGAILNGVVANHGLTVISRMLVTEKEKEGKLRIIPIRDAKFARTFNVVYHKNKFFSQPVSSLMEKILQYSYLGS